MINFGYLAHLPKAKYHVGVMLVQIFKNKKSKTVFTIADIAKFTGKSSFENQGIN